MDELKNRILYLLKRILGFINYTKLWSFYLRVFKKDSNKNFYDAYVYCNKRTKLRFFIVRMTVPLMGPGGAIRNYARVASWAEKHNYIPLLDWEYKSFYENGQIGIDNLAPLFFEFDYDINDIKDKYYTIVGTVNHVDVYDKKSCFWNAVNNNPYFEIDSKNVYTWKENLNRHIKIKEKILEQGNQFYKRELGGDGITLAVMMQEVFTDDAKSIYSSYSREVEKVMSYHPNSKLVDSYIEYAKLIMQRIKASNMFLSSAYSSTIMKFEDQVKNVKYCDRTRKSDLGGKEDRYSWILAIEDSMCEEYLKNRDWLIENYEGYLKEIIIASNCDYIIGNKSTGLQFSVQFSKNGTGFEII